MNNRFKGNYDYFTTQSKMTTTAKQTKTAATQPVLEMSYYSL